MSGLRLSSFKGAGGEQKGDKLERGGGSGSCLQPKTRGSLQGYRNNDGKPARSLKAATIEDRRVSMHRRASIALHENFPSK